MATYTRLGSILLAQELSAGPFGRIHRGLTLSGGACGKHVLVHTFSDEVLEAGIASRLEEASRVANILVTQRGFGSGYRFEAGRPAHMILDLVPGRSLVEMLDKTRLEQVPLGVDHALSVLQGAAQSLLTLHGRGQSHGVLSTHSIWISFEGATHLLDAPIAASLRTVLSRCPVAGAALARFRAVGHLTPLQADLYALGAILFELLTLERLPAKEAVTVALDRATLKAAQEVAPIPNDILGLLRRMLMVDRPYDHAQTFNTDLERVLYEGETPPTTFNMAFYMHTLFREENELDQQSMKQDKAADFTPFLSDGTESGRRVFESASGKSLASYYVVGGAAVVMAFAGLGYKLWSTSRQRRDAEQQVAQTTAAYYEYKSKLEDIKRQEQATTEGLAEVDKKEKEAKTKQEKEQLQKEREALQKKQQDLQEQEARNEAARREIQQRIEQERAQLSRSTLFGGAKTTPPRPTPSPAQTSDSPLNPSPLPGPLPKTTVAQQPVAAPGVSDPAPAQTQAQVQTQTSAPTIPAPHQPTPPAPSVVDNTETSAYMVRPVAPSIPALGPRKSFLPQSLQNADIKVVVRVVVDEQGRPLKVSVDQGVEGNFPYNDAAKEAAAKSAYAPSTRGGKPVRGGVVIIPFNFGKPR